MSNFERLKLKVHMLQTLPLKCDFKSDYCNQTVIRHPKVTSGKLNLIRQRKKITYKRHTEVINM